MKRIFSNLSASKNRRLLIWIFWLVIASFVVDHYWAGNASESSVRQTIENKIRDQQKDFNNLCLDSALIRQLATQTYNEKTLQHQLDRSYFFFIYNSAASDEDEPVFWNTQVVHPENKISSSNDKRSLVKLSNGWYVCENKQVSNQDALYTIVALIPVKWEYYINNKYLQNTFIARQDIENDYELSSTVKPIAVKGLNNEVLFYLQHIHSSTIVNNNTVAILLRLIAALLLLIFIHIEANVVVATKGLFKGFLVLLLPVLAIRIASYFLPVPINFRQIELFDPSIYGSNPVLRSLGDLFINALLFVWMILFIRYHLQGRNFHTQLHSFRKRTAILLIISLAMIFFTLLGGHIIRSLVADSQISFDVINFYTLNIYSVVGFFVLCSIATGYFFLMQILLLLAKSLTPTINARHYFVLAICGLIIETFRFTTPYVAFEILLLIWLLLYVFLMNYDYLNLLASKIIASRFIFWIFFFSVSITAIIVIQNQAKELSNRKSFAENLSNKSDLSGERMLNSVMIDFRNDFLSDVFPRFHKKLDNKYLKDSLINENTSGYLNKYETNIYTFDADENPLFNEDSSNFHILNAVVETQARPTAINGLYYYDVSFDRFNYISKKRVTDPDGVLQGYVFILLKPKKYKNDALYPELFSRGYVNSIESSPLYAYATYNKGKLSNSYNDYPFPTSLPGVSLSTGQFQVFLNHSYSELWYKTNDDKVIVIVKQESLLLEAITLFAYLFFVFLAVTATFRLLNMLVEVRFNPRKLKAYWHISIRNQVHGTIILISLFSFIIIGVATQVFFTRRYHNNNREKLSRTIHVMENEVLNSIDKISSNEDQARGYDSVSTEKLEQMVNRIAEVHSADLNLYDLNGDLKVSSLPLPYKKGIVSTKMDPLAYFHLSKMKDVQFFQEQMIGKLKYLSNYVPVRDQNGIEYAYLNIPYFESQSKLEEEISNFLVTIINLNAFIFLIAGIIALFITNRITRSFAFISNKMKEVNLGKVNEEITWTSRDEIGELVIEYNKMVKKLDSSAELLARSEREGAWREMARQVAHEIKNPLTPMKLNLQYLQMAIDNNSPNVKTISIYVAKILVEQIDHLSQIASDFAQFANIGQSNNQVFNLNDSLNHVSSLFSTTEKFQITLALHAEKIMIRADKTQINRLITNLVQNAIQSIPETRKGIIQINTMSLQDKVLISITDNGIGISSKMQSKIFTPNFTTKTSGTGLGLAMCKGIVEKSNGRIWFETEEGQRTTFYVELPVVK